VNTRPPTFATFCSIPEDMPTAYKRYLVNSMRQFFKMPGTPIRLMWRKGENPYASRARKIK
jgi:GTP-binding protein